MIAAVAWCAVQSYTGAIFVAVGVFAALLAGSAAHRDWKALLRNAAIVAAVIALLQVPYVLHQLSIGFRDSGMGAVTGKGLSSVLHERFSPKISYPAVLALVIANTINAGADITAIAAGINLLVPIPIAVSVAPIALLILVLQLWGNYRLIATIFMGGPRLRNGGRKDGRHPVLRARAAAVNRPLRSCRRGC